jgi:hypothetical protein
MKYGILIKSKNYLWVFTEGTIYQVVILVQGVNFMGNKGKLPSFATLYFYYTQPLQVSLIFVKITEP